MPAPRRRTKSRRSSPNKRGSSPGEASQVRAQTEAALQASERRFRALVEKDRDGVVLVGPDGAIRYESPAIVGILGYTPEERIGLGALDLIHPDDLPQAQELLGAVFTTGGRSQTILVRARHQDGSWRWIDAIATNLLHDPDVRAVVVNYRDVTERHQTALALRESEDRFRRLSEGTNEGVAIHEGGVILDASETLARILRCRVSELIGRSGLEFAAPESRDTMRQQIQAGSEETYQLVGVRTDGTRFVGEITGRPTTYKGRAAPIVTVRDVSERERAEEALRRSEERYRSFFEDVPSGDFITTPAGQIVDCNPAFLRMFGFASMDEARGVDVRTLYRDPADREALLQRLERDGRVDGQELDLVRRDGRPVFVVGTTVARRDGEGRLVEIKGYLLDETRRRELESQLLQSQKLQSLGTLAGGIAHDFNNILGIIVGRCAFLQEAPRDPETVTHSIDIVAQAAERGAALVRQLLTFARQSETKFEPLEAGEVVADVARLIQETFPKTIALDTSLSADIPVILADRNQIHQVLLNLCVNARDAMPKGGTLSIATTVCSGDLVRQRWVDADADRYVEVAISDCGTGMDEATRQRIFEPFFTTKELGKGTGLGLAVVYGIVRGHEGFVDVESTVGTGTTFRVLLPARAEQFALPLEAPPKSAETRGGEETVLVVEDEHQLRALLVTALSRKGYHVLEARDGEEAMQIFAARREEIALVLTDLGLPKLAGDEVCRRIKTADPSMCVILASGFIDPDKRADLALVGVRHVVQKPYLPNDILALVRNLLDQSTSPGDKPGVL